MTPSKRSLQLLLLTSPRRRCDNGSVAVTRTEASLPTLPKRPYCMPMRQRLHELHPGDCEHTEVKITHTKTAIPRPKDKHSEACPKGTIKTTERLPRNPHQSAPTALILVTVPTDASTDYATLTGPTLPLKVIMPQLLITSSMLLSSLVTPSTLWWMRPMYGTLTPVSPHT